MYTSELRTRLKEFRQIMTSLEEDLKYFETQINDNNITDLNHVFYQRKFVTLSHIGDCYVCILIIKDNLSTLSKE